jgi:tetratricopeptide (TPR) repeat protein
LWERSLIESRHQYGRTSLRLYRATAEYARAALDQEPQAAKWVSHFNDRMLELAERRLDDEDEASSVRWLIRHGTTLAELARTLLRQANTESGFSALLAASRAALLHGPVRATLSLFDDLDIDSLPQRDQRARALHTRARLRHRDGQSQAASKDYAAALALVSKTGSHAALTAAIALDQGTYHRHQGSWKRAEALYRRAQATHRKLGDRAGLARATAAVAALAHERGHLSRAKRLFEQALEEARKSSLALTTASTLQNLGIVLLELGQREDAARAFDAAIIGHKELGHRRFEGVGEFDLASLALEQGAVGEALLGFRRALGLAREVGDRREIGLSMALVAACEAGLGDPVEGARGLSAAETVLRAVDEPALLAALELYRGHVDLARALEAFDQGDQKEQRTRLNEARLRLESAGSEPSDSRSISDEVRYARRTLAAAYERHLALDEHAIVDFSGNWFRGAGGERVDLTRRAPLRRLLSELSRQLVHAPGAPVPIDRLIQCGWPDQTAVTKAAKNRLHVAITTLRKAGLDAHLVTRDDGYLLERAIAWHGSRGQGTLSA